MPLQMHSRITRYLFRCVRSHAVDIRKGSGLPSGHVAVLALIGSNGQFHLATLVHSGLEKGSLGNLQYVWNLARTAAVLPKGVKHPCELLRDVLPSVRRECLSQLVQLDP